MSVIFIVAYFVLVTLFRLATNLISIFRMTIQYMYNHVLIVH